MVKYGNATGLALSGIWGRGASVDMARLLASVTLSPVGNEQLERGVHGESQCRVASSTFFAGEEEISFCRNAA